MPEDVYVFRCYISFIPGVYEKEVVADSVEDAKRLVLQRLAIELKANAFKDFRDFNVFCELIGEEHEKWWWDWFR